MVTSRLQSADPSSYRPDIDGLRALAVLSVFAFHLFPEACPGGFVGVDVFFVISGYLITRIIVSEAEDAGFSFIRFYERRVRRIGPALAGLLIGASVGMAFLLTPDEYVKFANSAGAAALSVSNLYFWKHTGYFELGSNSLPLLHTWSLAVEEQFYLVFPALFVLGRRLRLGWWTIFGSLVTLSLLLSLVETPTDPTAAFYSPATRAWEFLLGSLALLTPRLTRRKAELVALAGAALIVASLVLIDDGSPFPGWRALAPCLGATALICSGEAARLATPLRLPPVVFIGRISYSLYLWHWPIIVAARIFWGGRFSLVEALFVAVVAVVLAYLSWRFVEEPVRRRRTVFTRRRLFAGAGAIAVLMVGQGLVINRGHGFPARYNGRALAYLQQPSWDAPPGCGGEAGDDCKTGGPSAAPSFAVIADSLGLLLEPAIDAFATQRGRSGLYFAKGGCIPMLGAGDAGCRKFVKAAVSKIAADPGIRTVLLIGRWPTAVESRRFGRQNSRTSPIEAAAFIAAFNQTREALGNRRVLVLENIPEQPVDVPIDEADRANLGLPAFAGVERSVFEDRVRRTNLLLSKVTAPRERLDASRLLCNATFCIAAEAGRSLYSDDNHLSVLGAQYLARGGLFDSLVSP